MLSKGQLITGTVEQLAFGGAGILRFAGMVVFVPFTVPGDQIQAQIIEVKKKHAIGKVWNLLIAGPDRVQPKCPYFGVCGGCQIQHMRYEAQLAYKKQAVEDALRRIAGLSEIAVSMEPAEPYWYYRRHIHLQLRRLGKERGFACGYICLDNRTLLPVDECPIFIEESSSILPQVRSLAAAIPTGINQEGRLGIFKIQNGFFAHFHFGSAIPPTVEPIMRSFIADHPQWRGLQISSPSLHHEVGEQSFLCETNGLTVEASTRAFLQNHPQQSALIYERLLQRINRDCGPVLDLYCGIGVTSLLLSKRGFPVTGIEYNRHAVQLAKRNAQLNHCCPEFILGKVEDYIESALLRNKSEIIVLNPPKEGVNPTILESILRHRPKHIFYISCMPSTLARDLKLLQTAYSATYCQAFDMFPQTAHVETLVELSRK